MPSIFRSNRPHTLYAALVLLTLAGLFGGASRYDVGTNIVPRLAACWTIVYLLWRRHGSPVRVQRPVLIFWLAVFAVPLIQLVPLPWSAWTALPGRGLAKDVLVAIGEQPWLGISLTPDRTIETLLSLIVPAAAYLLGSNLDFAGRAVVLRAILALALISAVLGLMQVSGGAGSRLYLYAVTNDDSAVGFFANANHLGLLLAGAIVISMAWLAESMAVSGKVRAPSVIACGLSVGVLLFAIAATNSRAAAILSVIAIIAGLSLIPFGRIGVKRRYVIAGGGALAAGLAATLGLLLSGTLLSGRFAIGEGPEGRVDVLPQLLKAIADFFPFGSGMGSFEPVFRSYEQASRLDFGYWNQAHQDYAQVAMEAGLAGIVLVVAFLAWYLLHIVGIRRRPDPSSRVRRQQVTAALVVMLVLLHSAADYPLRTSAIAAIFGFLASFIVAPFDSSASVRRRARGKFGDEAFPGYEQN